jgi:hypothetical protein
VALILAGLALFIAINGSRSFGNERAPQPIIVQPAEPSSGTTVPVAPAPERERPVGPSYSWGAHHGHWGHAWPFFSLFPLVLLAGLIFLAFRFFGPRRGGWGGPGWYGSAQGAPAAGPGPGYGPQPPTPPQGQPYQQYPPGGAQGQPYAGYPQGQPQQPQQSQWGQGDQGGQPTQAIGRQDDITRPEGGGEY